MRRFLLTTVSVLAITICGAVSRLSADNIMDVNVTNVDPRFRNTFLQAEAFWESRLLGYSPLLPAQVRSQLTRLQINAQTAAIDGVGGILGSAGPTNVVRWGGPGPKQFQSRPIAIATSSQMQFDIADIVSLQQTGSLLDVVKHEMGHALGFGSLWNGNGLLTTILGGPQYTGTYGLGKYRTESGNRFARFVPVEQQGGGGTAGSHWEDNDPFFNKRGTLRQSELMIGSIDPGNETKYTTETTWASLADLWFIVKGINDPQIYVRPRPSPSPWNWGGGPPLFIRGDGPSSVPEPSSMIALALGGIAAAVVYSRRRRGNGLAK